LPQNITKGGFMCGPIVRDSVPDLGQTFADVKQVKSPQQRGKFLLTLAKLTQGELFDKIVEAIVSLGDIPVNSCYDADDVKEAALAYPSALQAIFGILMVRGSYERAFELLHKVQSPKERAEGYIKIAQNTVNNPLLFEKVIKAIEELDALCISANGCYEFRDLKEGERPRFDPRDLKEVESARNKAFKVVVQLLIHKKEFEKALELIEKNVKNPMKRAECLVKLAEAIPPEGPLFKKIKKISESFDACPGKRGYSANDLRQVDPAHLSLKRKIEAISNHTVEANHPEKTSQHSDAVADDRGSSSDLQQENSHRRSLKRKRTGQSPSES
jgi:tetratricopeptide (TPR) repeat protein